MTNLKHTTSDAVLVTIDISQRRNDVLIETPGVSRHRRLTETSPSEVGRDSHSPTSGFRYGLMRSVEPMSERFPASDFKFEADFHDLRARNLEIGTWSLCVVMHECENLFAPARQSQPPG